MEVNNQEELTLQEIHTALSSKEAFKTWVRDTCERLNALESRRPFRAESTEQDNLRKAIASASLDCKIPGQSSSNMYKKPVSSLEDLQSASKEACKKHNLGINFNETEDDTGRSVLLTTVIHIPTGEFKVYTTPAEPVKNENPAYARAGGYTYAKRKLLQSLFNLGGELD